MIEMVKKSYVTLFRVMENKIKNAKAALNKTKIIFWLTPGFNYWSPQNNTTI